MKYIIKWPAGRLGRQLFSNSAIQMLEKMLRAKAIEGGGISLKFSIEDDYAIVITDNRERANSIQSMVNLIMAELSKLFGVSLSDDKNLQTSTEMQTDLCTITMIDDGPQTSFDNSTTLENTNEMKGDK